MAAASMTDSMSLSRLQPSGRSRPDQRVATGADGRQRRFSDDVAESQAAVRAIRTAVDEPGVPLDDSTRDVMTAHYHHNFASVRIHHGGPADRAAAAVGSLAFTVGDHVVFANGHYDPATPVGRRVLAHELAHVLQQRAGPVTGHRVGANLRVGDSQDSSERAAEAAAESVGRPSVEAREGRRSELSGGTAPAERRPPPAGIISVQRIPVRRDLLTAGDEQTDRPMRGNDAHRKITETFIREVGPFTRLRIPGGSRAPFEDPESCSSDSEPTMVSPLIYNDNPRSRQGQGVPDLVYRQPGRIELAEIKPASHTCAVFGETQVANYVAKGNGDSGFGSSLPAAPGTQFLIMPPGRWQQLPHHERLQNLTLTYDWVANGVIGYLATRSQDQDTLLCGFDDAGKIDAFIQRASDPALEILNTTINVELNQSLTRLIDGLSLQQMLERVLGHQIASRWLNQLDETIRRQLELQIRAALHSLKDRLVREVTQRLRARLRDILTELVTTACAAGVVFTTRELLRQLRARARTVVWEEGLTVALAMLQSAIRALVPVALAAAVFVIASILIVLLVLDDGTGLGVIDDVLIPPVTAAAAWASRILAAAAESLLPLLRLTPVLGAASATMGPAGAPVEQAVPGESATRGPALSAGGADGLPTAGHGNAIPGDPLTTESSRRDSRR